MKMQPTKWDEIFTNHISDLKGLVSRIYKEFLDAIKSIQITST